MWYDPLQLPGTRYQYSGEGFEYMKKSSKELGPALIGIELANKEDLEPFVNRMQELEIEYTKIEHSDILYSYLI